MLQSSIGAMFLFLALSFGAQATEMTFPKDYQKYRYGLFIHWSAPGGLEPRENWIKNSDGTSAMTLDEYANGLNVEKIADDIAGLGFELVYLTDFHGCGSTLHPLGALDRWRGPGYAAKRDVVREFIDALAKHGIGLVLFTHPLDGHDYPEEQQQRLGWNDPENAYKKWNDFINDVYRELVERYGDAIVGMGFDSEWGESGNEEWAGKLDLPRLRDTILGVKPDLTLVSLTGPNLICPYGMREIYDPSWFMPWKSRSEDDYNVEDWPGYTNTAAIVLGNHWTTLTKAEEGHVNLTADQLYRYTVLQTATATEGMGILWAASPYADGSWEKGTREVFAAVSQEHAQAMAEAVKHTFPSTSYPLKEGTKLATLPRGVVALRSQDDRCEYLHVMNAPTIPVLMLPPPADGKRFESASLLRDGRALKLQQNRQGLTLTLPDEVRWDPVDTVIKLTVAYDSIPTRSLAFHKPVFASSSEETQQPGFRRSEWGRIRLVDGLVEPFPKESVDWRPYGNSPVNLGWSSKPESTEESSQWVKVDLLEPHTIRRVVLHPRMDCPNKGEGFPRNFTIQISADGDTWKTVAAVADAPRPHGAQQFDCAPTAARYVRVKATRLRAMPGKEGEYRMQLAELEVF